MRTPLASCRRRSDGRRRAEQGGQRRGNARGTCRKDREGGGFVHALKFADSAPLSRAHAARLAGIEPPTTGLEGRCSIQLSYRRGLPITRSVPRCRSSRVQVVQLGGHLLALRVETAPGVDQGLCLGQREASLESEPKAVEPEHERRNPRLRLQVEELPEGLHPRCRRLSVQRPQVLHGPTQVREQLARLGRLPLPHHSASPRIGGRQVDAEAPFGLAPAWSFPTPRPRGDQRAAQLRKLCLAEQLMRSLPVSVGIPTQPGHGRAGNGVRRPSSRPSRPGPPTAAVGPSGRML